MPILIDDLVDPLKAAVNAPGGTALVTAGRPAWAAALSNAFWETKLMGFFSEYRIDPQTQEISPVPPATDDMPGEVQQLIVMVAALRVFENVMTSLDTKFRAKSGEAEFETQKTASLLIEVLKGRRAQLDKLREDLVATVTGTTYVGVIDMVALRVGAMASGAQQWVGQ